MSSESSKFIMTGRLMKQLSTPEKVKAFNKVLDELKETGYFYRNINGIYFRRHLSLRQEVCKEIIEYLNSLERRNTHY